MSVRTTFQMLDGTTSLEVVMPYPVRVGEEVEISSVGLYNVVVQSVAWIVSLDDSHTDCDVELLARVR